MRQNRDCVKGQRVGRLGRLELIFLHKMQLFDRMFTQKTNLDLGTFNSFIFVLETFTVI